MGAAGVKTFLCFLFVLFPLMLSSLQQKWMDALLVPTSLPSSYVESKSYTFLPHLMLFSVVHACTEKTWLTPAASLALCPP